MSAKRSALKRKERKDKPRCRMCRGTDIETKEYPDEAVLLYICQTCGYPWRSKIPKEQE